MSTFPLLYGGQRLQRLQLLCAEDDVSLLFIVGIDSKHNIEAVKFLHYLCFGATGKDLLRKDLDEAFECMDETVILVQSESVSVIWNSATRSLLETYLLSICSLVQYTYSKEEEGDVDLFQVRKCSHFKRMMMSAMPDHGRVGMPLPAVYETCSEIEAWPLIQSFAVGLSDIDGSPNPFLTGFFSATYQVIDYSRLLNERVYRIVDGFAFDGALSTVWNSALPSHKDTMRLISDFFHEHEEISASEQPASFDIDDMVSPLQIFFDFKAFQSVSDDISLQPVLLFGDESQALGNAAEIETIVDARTSISGKDLDRLRESALVILNAGDPCSGVRWCRTYLPSRGCLCGRDISQASDGTASAAEEDGRIQSSSRRLARLYSSLCGSLRESVLELSGHEHDLSWVRDRLTARVSPHLDNGEHVTVEFESRDSFGLLSDSDFKSSFVYVTASVRGIRIGETSSNAIAVGDTFLLSHSSLGAYCLTSVMPYSMLTYGRGSEMRAAEGLLKALKQPVIRSRMGLETRSGSEGYYSTSIVTDSASTPRLDVGIRAYDGGFVVERIDNCSCPPLVCVFEHHVDSVSVIDAADIGALLHSPDKISAISASGFFVVMKLKAMPQANNPDCLSMKPFSPIETSDGISYCVFYIASDASSFFEVWRMWRTHLIDNRYPLYRKGEWKAASFSSEVLVSIGGYISHLHDVDEVSGIVSVDRRVLGIIPVEGVGIAAVAESTNSLQGQVRSLRATLGATLLSTAQHKRSTSLKVLLVIGVAGSGVLAIGDQIRTRFSSIIASAQLPLDVLHLHYESFAASLDDVESDLKSAGVRAGDSLVVVTVAFVPVGAVGLRSLIQTINQQASHMRVISLTAVGAALRVNRVGSAKTLDSAFKSTSLGLESLESAFVEAALASDVMVVIDDDQASKEYTKFRNAIRRVSPSIQTLRVTPSITWIDSEEIESWLDELSSANAKACSNHRLAVPGRHSVSKPMPPQLKSSFGLRSLQALKLNDVADYDIDKLVRLLQLVFPHALLSLGSDLTDLGWKVPTPNGTQAFRRAIALAKAKMVASLERKANDAAFASLLKGKSDELKKAAANLFSIHGFITIHTKGMVSRASGIASSQTLKRISVESNCGCIIIRTMESYSPPGDYLYLTGTPTLKEYELLVSLLSNCVLHQLPQKSLLQKENLSVAQLKVIQTQTRSEELPSGWAYDGATYVSFGGEKKPVRPDILSLSATEDYLAKRNADITFFNEMRDSYYGGRVPSTRK